MTEQQEEYKPSGDRTISEIWISLNSCPRCQKGYKWHPLIGGSDECSNVNCVWKGKKASRYEV